VAAIRLISQPTEGLVPVQKIIRATAIADYIGISRRQCERLIAEGKFPQKVKLGGKAAGWLVSEVDAWVNARAAERNAQKGGAAQ
jgi:prophage regulatory protein